MGTFFWVPYPQITALFLDAASASRQVKNRLAQTLILGNSRADLLAFHIRFIGEAWSCARLPLSIPLVQLRAPHKPKPHRTRFRALRFRCAPEIDSASLCSPLALHE